MKMLVIENDPAQHTWLAAILEKIDVAGYFCSTVETGLEKLAHSAFNLVLLDLSIPGKTGLYALKKIRENIKTKQLPVIIMTADRSREALLQAAALGISDYLIKPVSAELMTQKLTIYKRIVSISQDKSANISLSSIDLERTPGITKFIFTGQLGRYSVPRFQDLYSPLLQIQIQNDVLMLNVSAVPAFGPTQIEPFKIITDLMEPRQPIIVAGKNFGPLMPVIRDIQSRLFMNEEDAMTFLKIKGAEQRVV